MIKEKENAITLIALVLTIVILLIITGVGISQTISNNGIIKETQQSAELTNEVAAKETMNRVIFEYSITKTDKTLEEFLKTKVPDTIDSVKNNGDGTLTISKNGYTLDVNNKKSNSFDGTSDPNDNEIKISVNAYTGVYDGKAHKVITNISVVPSNAIIEYSIDGKNFDTVMPTITDVSSVNVTVRASKRGYQGKTINVVATIEKAEGKIILSEMSGKILYPNNRTITVIENTGNISAVSADNNIATVSVNGNDVTIIPGRQDGTVVVTVKSEETERYSEKTATYIATVERENFTGESGVGYYADVDEDGVPDGIIFADLKVGGSGSWGGPNYSKSYYVSKISTSKEYYVSKTNYEGKMRKKRCISDK